MRSVLLVGQDILMSTMRLKMSLLAPDSVFTPRAYLAVHHTSRTLCCKLALFVRAKDQVHLYAHMSSEQQEDLSRGVIEKSRHFIKKHLEVRLLLSV